MTSIFTINSPQLSAALAFMYRRGRLLERRLTDFWFIDSSEAAAIGVVDVLRTYRHRDGGLGYALEPDVRAARSQPLFVDFALEIADQLAATEVGRQPAVRDQLHDFAQSLVPYLESVADEDGGLPIVLPSAAEYERADHWGDCVIPAGINPTANIVARLRTLDAGGDWLDTAENYCRTKITELSDSGDLNGHSLANVLRFLEHAESCVDQDWARTQRRTLTDSLADLPFFNLYPHPDYGVTALDLAPLPDDPRRSLFPDDAIVAHLAAVEREQSDDGGWPMTWQPPGQTAEGEWRGVITLAAMRALAANQS